MTRRELTAEFRASIRLERQAGTLNINQDSQFANFVFTNTLRRSASRCAAEIAGWTMSGRTAMAVAEWECGFLNAGDIESETRTGIGSWIGQDARRCSFFAGPAADEAHAMQENRDTLAVHSNSESILALAPPPNRPPLNCEIISLRRGALASRRKILWCALAWMLDEIRLVTEVFP
jgi:hypothetical protein